MAKDYFQDIVPPENPNARPASPVSEEEEPTGAEVPIRVNEGNLPARGIRNISGTRAAARSTNPQPGGSRPRMGGDMRPPAQAGESYTTRVGMPPRGRRNRPTWLIWGAALLSLLILLALILLAFRSTVVTVIPKSHTVVFDQSSKFTAYPAATVATGTLSYTVSTSDLEDSEVVPAQGTTTTKAQKASGEITVVNNYSTASVRLIKNTRFATSDGLIFRVPAEVVIPGKKGTTPGTVSVTVFADRAGAQYNVGPVARFTIPGLASTPQMYANVYARSTGAITGGSAGGAEPAIAPAALDAAIATVRGRLGSEAHTVASNDASFMFPDLTQITYQDLPNTVEVGGGVRIHEKAHIETPIFPADIFAQAIARSVSADSENAPVVLIPSKNFAAHFMSATSSSLGTRSIDFTLSGGALLVWKVDVAALSQALAGRDQSAFQEIVNGFPGIQEAHARIEPFWKSSFPASASDIKIQLQTPQVAQ